LVKKKISKLPKIEETLKEPEVGDTVEADEIWSFVGNKKNKVWLWLALCRRTRQIIAFFIGDRTAKSCKKLWEKIPENFKQKAVFATDLFEAYNAVFPKYKHYAILKESGETTHIERFNCTLRQRIGRYVRKTLSFSKSQIWHELITRLFIVNYNLSV
jgi:insertion element IS1 protein InsB